MGDWQAVGAVGEWAGAIVTLLALGFAWWVFHTEREEVGLERAELAKQREATEGALRIAKEALDFERVRYQADQEHRDRRTVSGLSILNLSINNDPIPSATLVVRNGTSLPIFDLAAFLVFQGVVHQSYPPLADPLRPNEPHPADVVIKEIGQKRENLLHDNTGYGVTFRDDLGNTWAKWSTGRLIRWTPGDRDALRAGR